MEGRNANLSRVEVLSTEIKALKGPDNFCDGGENVFLY